jgi:hypothetical protein
VAANAVRLRCAEGDAALWDFSPLVSLYGQQKMFMVGEAHGSNEIGLVSALIFETLASRRLVNVLGMELPMDYEAPLQRSVDTGSDPTGEQVVEQLAPNMFGSILPKAARKLVVSGLPIRVAAVDIPTDPNFALKELQQLVAKLDTQKEAALAVLPKTLGRPPSASEITQANGFYDAAVAKQAEICTELSADDCDRFVAMFHALWASTTQYGAEPDAEWFMRREVAIYANMRAKMRTNADRMFLHMGAFHTNKFEASAGSRMAKEYPLTKGQVFSLAPAYGQGSTIWYGEDVSVPPSPPNVAKGLADATDLPMFVSATRPSAACVQNPIGIEGDEDVGVGGLRGELYDGFIYYGRLTSEQEPDQATLSSKGNVTGKALRAFRDRMRAKETAALRSGLLRTAHPGR